MLLTPEKIKGIQFEIWLEILLKYKGHQNVVRDVEYHKSRYVFRQVDLRYDIVEDGLRYHTIVEAKYSSNSRIPYYLRKGTINKAGQDINGIDNLIDEVSERQRFVKADITILATNRHFDDKVKTEAKKYNIRVIENEGLTDIYRSLGGKLSIDSSIRSIYVKNHNLSKNIIYI